MDLPAYESNAYYAEDDETPKIIAAKLSMDVKDLVAINKIEYKGLQHYSKLMPGTKLIVAYDGRMMKRKRSTMHVPADEMAAVFKTLKKLDKERYFALPVTDEMAPLYSKIILYPMHFLMMRKHFEAGKYADFAALREDFSLICRNAVIYNEAESEFAAIATDMFEKGMALLDEVAIRFGGADALNDLDEDGTVAGTDNAGDPDAQERCTKKKKAGTASSNSTKLQFWPNSRRHHALPRLATVAAGTLTKVAPFSVKEISANGCSPVTDLHYSSRMSFGPSFDTTQANQDARSCSSFAHGVDRSPSGWRTDHKKVASFSYLQHASSVIGTVRRLQTPMTDLWAQHDAMAALNAMPQGASTKAEGGGAGCAAVEPGGTGGAATAPTTIPRAAPGVPPLAPPPADAAAALVANAGIIQQLVKLRTARMRSQKPWLVSEAECQEGALMRRNLLASLKSSGEGPGGFITQEYVRSLIGADSFVPKEEKGFPEGN